MSDGPVSEAYFRRVIGTLMEQMEEHSLRQQKVTADAIAQGIRSAVTDPSVVRCVMDEVAKAAQERATAAAGRGAWWLVKSVMSKWIVIAVIVIMTAKFLGWDMAAKIGKFLSGATP